MDNPRRTAVGIRIAGSHGTIYLPDVIGAGSDLLELLSEVDSSMSPSYRPNVDWRLVKLSYSSPAEILAEPVVREDQPDNRAGIVDTVILGLEGLKSGADRPRWFSDKALGNAHSLVSRLSNGVDSMELFTYGVSVKCTVDISANINTILKPGREIYGSIEGRLETLNSHGEFKFAIFEPILARRIRCDLMDEKDIRLKGKVVGLYEHNVLVSGLLRTNIKGEVHSAKVDGIVGRDRVQVFKDAVEVTGIYDLTGGLDPAEHIRRMRDA